MNEQELEAKVQEVLDDEGLDAEARGFNTRAEEERVFFVARESCALLEEILELWRGRQTHTTYQHVQEVMKEVEVFLSIPYVEFNYIGWR